MTMTLVSTVTVGAGGAASIDFTSIPQTGTDLLLVVSARTNDATPNAPIKLVINNDTSSIYSGKNLRGNSSAVASFGSTYNNIGPLTPVDAGAASGTSNTFGSSNIYIPNYTSTTTKSLSVETVSENNSSTAFDAMQYLWAISYANSTGITRLTLSDNYGGNFVQYSSASLYIVTKGNGGASVA